MNRGWNDMKALKKRILIKTGITIALLLMLATVAWAQSYNTVTPTKMATATATVDPNAYLWGQINKAKNPGNLTTLEQAHVPAIVVNGTPKAGEPVKVTVRVGEGHMHPSTHDHFIQWIELYSGDILLGRVDLSPATSKPEVTFTVVLDNSTTLRARQNCNLHGTWENSKAVQVT